MSIYNRKRNGVESDSWTIVITLPGTGGKRLTRTFRGTRRDAERRERDLISAVEAERWAEIDRTRLRAVVTLQDLGEEWTGAGMPKPGGRPRSPEQQTRLAPFVRTAIAWWGARSPGGIGPRDFEAFGQYKRLHARSGTGERAADLEINALAQLCAWAVASGRLQTNPFLDRPAYRDPDAVQHCPNAMPVDDEELHLLVGTMFEAGGVARVAGAHLMFQALTGLRPGEPGALRWDARGEQPGTRLTVTREGHPVQLMRVARLKGGINPAVRIHPVLEQFLGAWRAHTLAEWPDSPWLFPHPDHPQRPLVPLGDTADSGLGRLLSDAAKAIGAGPRKPHSMRAYYVRVRRSQGIEDATIAVELGQGSGPGLVVRTYGERLAILGGDGLYDWMPEGSEPCWSRLVRPANIISMERAA